MSFMREAALAIAPEAAPPPAKRVKIEQESTQTPSQVEDVVMEDGTSGEGGPAGAGGGGGDVQDLGSKLWQSVRNTLAKDGREIALAFLRQPPRTMFPDYYDIIQQPIALEDIQQKLEDRQYESFKAVKRDLDLCFNNAKEYNQEDSGIYKDAKHLGKSASKEYARLGGVSDGDGADGKVKKPKVPSLQRQMKSRIGKLIEKTAEDGRLLAGMFMELPSKKEWPEYYVQITRPMCFDIITKKVKKKEYTTSAQFAADVELVFSNAMQFNQDDSIVFHDALALKEHFARIMADIPAEFALPQYMKQPKAAPVKIKIKMPGVHQPPAPSYTPPQPTSTQPAYSQPTYAQPAAPTYTPSAPLPTPAAPKPAAFSLPSAHSISVHQKNSASAGPSHQRASAVVVPNLPLPPVPTPKVPAAPKPPKKQGPPPQPAQHQYTPAPIQPFAQPSFNYNNQYINAYKPPLPVPTRYASPVVVQAAPPHVSIPVVPRVAAALVHPRHQLRHISVTTEPLGRRIPLRYEDGVKSWAVRLGVGERSLRINDIQYNGQPDGESSGDEEDDEDEDDGDEEYGKKGKGKGKGKKRGRPPKMRGSEAPQAERHFKKRNRVRAVRVPDEVSVILNGTVVPFKKDNGGEWTVDLPAGLSVVEIGQKGVLLWKVFAQRAT